MKPLYVQDIGCPRKIKPESVIRFPIRFAFMFLRIATVLAKA